MVWLRYLKENHPLASSIVAPVILLTALARFLRHHCCTRKSVDMQQHAGCFCIGWETYGRLMDRCYKYVPPMTWSNTDSKQFLKLLGTRCCVAICVPARWDFCTLRSIVGCQDTMNGATSDCSVLGLLQGLLHWKSECALSRGRPCLASRLSICLPACQPIYLLIDQILSIHPSIHPSIYRSI